VFAGLGQQMTYIRQKEELKISLLGVRTTKIG
jgi:hypothetical protein